MQYLVTTSLTILNWVTNNLLEQKNIFQFSKRFFFPISKKKDFLFIFIRYFEDLTRLECTIERSRLLRCDQGWRTLPKNPGLFHEFLKVLSFRSRNHFFARNPTYPVTWKLLWKKIGIGHSISRYWTERSIFRFEIFRIFMVHQDEGISTVFLFFSMETKIWVKLTQCVEKVDTLMCVHKRLILNDDLSRLTWRSFFLQGEGSMDNSILSVRRCVRPDNRRDGWMCRCSLSEIRKDILSHGIRNDTKKCTILKVTNSRNSVSFFY